MARLAPLLLFELDGRQHPVPDVLLFRVVEHLNAVRPPFGAGLPGLSIGVVTGPLIGSQKGPLPLVASGQRA